MGIDHNMNVLVCYNWITIILGILDQMSYLYVRMYHHNFVINTLHT